MTMTTSSPDIFLRPLFWSTFEPVWALVWCNHLASCPFLACHPAHDWEGYKLWPFIGWNKRAQVCQLEFSFTAILLPKKGVFSLFPDLSMLMDSSATLKKNWRYSIVWRSENVLAPFSRKTASWFWAVQEPCKAWRRLSSYFHRMAGALTILCFVDILFILSTVIFATWIVKLTRNNGIHHTLVEYVLDLRPARPFQSHLAFSSMHSCFMTVLSWPNFVVRLQNRREYAGTYLECCVH